MLVLWRASPQDAAELVTAAPSTSSTTPHHAWHPGVLVRLAAVDVAELSELLAEAWQVRAPARLRRQHRHP